jgi:hypothetical protein
MKGLSMNYQPPPPPNYQQPSELPYPDQPPQYQPVAPPPVLPPKKKNWFLTTYGIFTVALLAVFFLGFGVGRLSNTTSTPPATTATGAPTARATVPSLSSSPINIAPTPTSVKTTPSTNQHFKAGDTVTVANTWQVVVSAPKTSAGQKYLEPKAGNTFLLIDVTLTNISNQEQQLYGNINWSLKGTDGQKYDNTYFTDTNPPDGKIEAAGPAKGTLAYEVPTTVKEFRLSFEADAFRSGQTIWDLSL